MQVLLEEAAEGEEDEWSDSRNQRGEQLENAF